MENEERVSLSPFRNEREREREELINYCIYFLSRLLSIPSGVDPSTSSKLQQQASPISSDSFSPYTSKSTLSPVSQTSSTSLDQTNRTRISLSPWNTAKLLPSTIDEESSIQSTTFSASANPPTQPSCPLPPPSSQPYPLLPPQHPTLHSNVPTSLYLQACHSPPLTLLSPNPSSCSFKPSVNFACPTLLSSCLQLTSSNSIKIFCFNAHSILSKLDELSALSLILILSVLWNLGYLLTFPILMLLCLITYYSVVIVTTMVVVLLSM